MTSIISYAFRCDLVAPLPTPIKHTNALLLECVALVKCCKPLSLHHGKKMTAGWLRDPAPSYRLVQPAPFPRIRPHTTPRAAPVTSATPSMSIVVPDAKLSGMRRRTSEVNARLADALRDFFDGRYEPLDTVHQAESIVILGQAAADGLRLKLAQALHRKYQVDVPQGVGAVVGLVCNSEIVWLCIFRDDAEGCIAIEVEWAVIA
jgi:hypothetical protein